MKRDKQFLVRVGIEQAEIDFVPRCNLSPTQQASGDAGGERAGVAADAVGIDSVLGLIDARGVI